MFPGRLDLSKRGSARVGLTGSGRAGDKAGGRSRAGGRSAGRVRRTGAGRRSRFVDHDGRRGGADVRATLRGRPGAQARPPKAQRGAAAKLGGSTIVSWVLAVVRHLAPLRGWSRRGAAFLRGIGLRTVGPRAFGRVRRSLGVPSFYGANSSNDDGPSCSASIAHTLPPPAAGPLKESARREPTTRFWSGSSRLKAAVIDPP